MYDSLSVTVLRLGIRRKWKQTTVVQFLVEFFLAMGLDAIRNEIRKEIIGKGGHKTIFLSVLKMPLPKRGWHPTRTST
jgi:hypothetical protein